MKTFTLYTALIFYCLCVSNTYAVNQLALESLDQLSLEELMGIDITIATKKEKKLISVAAPVFVITADDIRRSGASNVPEALRMAPGVQVAKVGPHDWAVTIRGFNDLLANKLLVLVDGRTIYNATNSGTYWRDIQSMAMENIKQIEIIRGPGGTIWGANAVNGVINIITYSALETEGGKLVVGGGSEQRAMSSISYSKKITELAAIKANINYFKVDDGKDLTGSNNKDGGDGWRTGLQFNFNNTKDQFSVDGAYYEHYLEYNSLHTLLVPPYSELRNTRPTYQGGHLLAKWSHQVALDNQWNLQVFYDYNNRNDAILQMAVDVWDVDFSHQFKVADQHTITWGTGYRHIRDKSTNTVSFAMSPANDDVDIVSLFAQDEIALDDEKKWLFTLGSKLEYYSLSKWEVEPSASLLWNINDEHSFWVSVSHAVRTPSRTQYDSQVFLFEELVAPNTPLMIQGAGNNDLNAENMTAYQFGWRGVFNEDLTADISFFYHDYIDITKTEVTGEVFFDSNGFAILPGRVNNNMNAQSYGVETTLNWQVTDWWRNYFTYSYFKINTSSRAGHTLFSPDSDELSAPQNIASWRAQFSLTHNINFDFWLRYTDETVTNNRYINDYIDLDLRLSWQIYDDIELSVVGQNLIQEKHLEFDAGFFYPVESTVERSVYGKAIWRF